MPYSGRYKDLFSLTISKSVNHFHTKYHKNTVLDYVRKHFKIGFEVAGWQFIKNIIKSQP